MSKVVKVDKDCAERVSGGKPNNMITFNEERL